MSRLSLVQAACRLSTANLKHEGFFARVDRRWRRTWRRGDRRVLVADYARCADPTTLALKCLAYERRGAEPRVFEQSLAILERPKLSGTQRFFVCERCAGTVSSMYWVENEPGFACRHCARLVYPSQRLHRNRLYDDLLHHLAILDTCESRLSRATTVGEVARIVRNAARAGACVDAYGASLAERVPGAIAAGAQLVRDTRDDERDGPAPFTPWWQGPTRCKQLELFA